MSETGRKRWWRAATVAVLGSTAVLGVWAGLSRSAPPEAPATWSRAAATTSDPHGTVSPVVAILPPIPSLSESDGLRSGVAAPPVVPAAAPAIPVAPPAAPPSLPVLPSVPIPAPVIPAVPSPEAPKTSLPPIAPVVPVLPPPAIVPVVPPVMETAPAPLPARSPGSVQPVLGGIPDSGLQGGNGGNTVKTENPGKSTGGIEPPALPALPPVPPVIGPATPAVGSPGEIRGTTVDHPKPNERPFLDSEKDIFPIPNFTATTPGDSTVNVLNQSVAAAVIGGMLFAPAGPASAAPPLTIPLTSPIDEKSDIAEMKTKLEAANTKLEQIQKDLKQLTELLNGRRDKEGFPIPTSPGLLADIKAISDRLAKVEEDLSKMKGTSSSLRPGTPPVTPVDPKAGKGTVRVVNEYPVQISIVVNGTSYRVAPSKSLDIDVPAGDFNYQLLESGAASTKSSIKEKETVTLRIK